MADLQIEMRRVSGATILDLTGEVDSYNAPKLRDRMERLIAEGESQLIINLSKVDYIDSTGIGMLVGGLKQASEAGGGIKLICPNKDVYRLFHITNLTRAFPIHDTEQAALEA
ncbi:MAG: STAS domain-containing protein [bacterium]|jgi:anti-sigma B factor antagonist